MTSSNNDQPSNRKYPQYLYRYVGPDQQYQGLWFIRIADCADIKRTIPWPGAEAWKYDMQPDEVTMTSLPENHLQPPPLRKMFCEFDPKPGNEEPEVGDTGIGGLLWQGSHEEFLKCFQQKGQK